MEVKLLRNRAILRGCGGLIKNLHKDRKLRVRTKKVWGVKKEIQAEGYGKVKKGK